VLRLEQATLRKFSQGEEVMGMHRRVDADGIIADRAAGMSIAAIAMKHNCARSTVSGYVNQKDSTPAAGANGAANGPAERTGKSLAASAELATLKALADAEWERLPVVERLRLLLSRGSA
jgi:hypothetical protein